MSVETQAPLAGLYEELLSNLAGTAALHRAIAARLPPRSGARQQHLRDAVSADFDQQLYRDVAEKEGGQ